MEIIWLALKKFCTMYGEAGLLTVMLLIGIAVWIYVLAGYGLFFAFIKSGEIVFVEEGKSFYKLIPNIPGYGVLNNKIAPIKEERVKQPKSFLGIFWVGFYPLRKIHKYDFSWDKAVSKEEAEREEKKGGKIEETGFAGVILSHRSEAVNSIRHRNSYPIIAKEVELAGQMKIDIFFNVIFQTVDPVFSVFILSGNWFSLARDAFSGIISDRIRGMELRKKPGQTTTEESFEALEKETVFNDLFKEKNIKIQNASGMIVAEVVYRDYALSGTPESKQAAEGLKIAELNAQTAATTAKGKADAVREEKQGEADGIRFVKKAEAEGIREVKSAEAETLGKKLEAASKHAQGGDIAIAQEYSGAIRDFQGSTIIFGASNVSPMIPIEQKKGGKKQP